MKLKWRIEAFVLPRWYEARARLFKRGWLIRILAGLVALLLAAPTVVKQLGTLWGWLFAGLWVFVGIWKGWKEFDPSHLQIVEKNYLARKLAFFPLVSKAQEWKAISSPGAVSEFQVAALKLIASYVRDHRTDFRGTRIFANLLVPFNGDLVVVARDLESRPVPVHYLAGQNLLCWQAFTANETLFTGDLYRSFPDTKPGKPYSSILAVPVRDARSRAIAVVSIDSSLRYHFDFAAEDLKFYLLPYIALLAWTIPLSIRDLQTKSSSGP